MKKIVRYGWLGKTFHEFILLHDLESDKFDLGNVYQLKGKKFEWHPEDWPPIKVRITVEEVK